ncbi:hypothetical protein [Polyangium sorediatum]|uniref:Uncharacterized protein n=1 Tax=Polyangium sorediatum TaxID=889274 RepID=A0ABT6NI41_9BACT|nr:hypothetical protein [Polyangium sorediatum]MDI1427976.1 hypothetical protein [Polyangium sorediatum]
MLRRVFVGCVVAVMVLLCRMPGAFAQTPVEVCWKPSGLPPGVNTFAVIEEKTGGALVILHAHEFWKQAERRVVLRYNPNLGPESLARIPSKARPPGCTPPPPKKPEAPAAKAPAPAAPPAPPPKETPKEEKKADAAESVEERVEERRAPERKEEPPKVSRESILPREGVLRQESVLPKRDEVHPPKCVDAECSHVDRGGALPELQHRHGRPLVSVVPCEQTKEGCKGKGDGTGKGKALTPLERIVRELAIASAMLNGEFNHDLARKDGKRFGIIGGDDEDGVDNAVVQAAAAITQIASGVLIGQAEKFAKKLEEACAKKASILLQGAEEVSKETAELLAKQYGRAIAEALEQNGAIGPYKTMREFTRGLEGDFQAHHILEKAMGRDLRITKELDNIPSVILTKEHHKKITDALDEARKQMVRQNGNLTPQGLWKVYKRVYKAHPHWLDAIRPYFSP